MFEKNACFSIKLNCHLRRPSSSVIDEYFGCPESSNNYNKIKIMVTWNLQSENNAYEDGHIANSRVFIFIKKPITVHIQPHSWIDWELLHKTHV